MKRNFNSELTFTTSRSSGKGGQHVNTTETKVELTFDVLHSALLDDEEKERFAKKWKNRINAAGEFKICSSQHRSQAANKQHVVNKFYDMLHKALRKQKKRIATSMPSEIKLIILAKKKLHSKKKEERGKKTRDFI